MNPPHMQAESGRNRPVSRGRRALLVCIGWLVWLVPAGSGLAADARFLHGAWVPDVPASLELLERTPFFDYDLREYLKRRLARVVFVIDLDAMTLTELTRTGDGGEPGEPGTKDILVGEYHIRVVTEGPEGTFTLEGKDIVDAEFTPLSDGRLKAGKANLVLRRDRNGSGGPRIP